MVETALQIARPTVDYAYAPQRIELSHFRSSDYLPYELRRNHSGRFRMQEFDTTVVTNNLGLRDDDVDMSKPRVICLGDSFTFGMGVENDETFCAGLERAFGGRDDFVNAGFADGNAPDTYALWLGHHLDALAPSALLVSLFQNDYRDVTVHTWEGGPAEGPPTRITEGHTIVTPDGMWLRDTPVAHWPPFARRWLKESYVVAVLRDRILRDAGEPAGDSPLTSAATAEAADQVTREQAGDARFTRALDLLFAAASGRPMAFHLIPARGQASDSHMDWLVRRWADEHGLPVIARYDAFDANDYFEHDGHWRPSGHAKAAAYLREALVKLGW